MKYRIDDGPRLFHIDLMDGVSAERALEEVLAVVQARPELWGWDWIVNVSFVPEDASVEQIARLALAYGTPRDVEALTMLVSGDANLHLWAKVMDFQFPRRKHRVTATLDSAMGQIEAARANRKMNGK